MQSAGRCAHIYLAGVCSRPSYVALFECLCAWQAKSRETGRRGGASSSSRGLRYVATRLFPVLLFASIGFSVTGRKDTIHNRHAAMLSGTPTSSAGSVAGGRFSNFLHATVGTDNAKGITQRARQGQRLHKASHYHEKPLKQRLMSQRRTRPSWTPGPCASTGAVFEQQDFALRELYNATTGAQWWQHGNWLNSSVGHESWYGVVCSNDTDTVKYVTLPNNNLAGSIPSSLGSMTQMTYL